MNERHPFTADDLSELDARLLSEAAACVAMQEIHDGNHDVAVVGLRHDVDAGHALATAVRMAEWEADRGYRSTYFLLHTAPYWGGAAFAESVERIVQCGHEIGIHTNALAEALRTGGDPDVILQAAINELRSLGVRVRGVAAHGDPLCIQNRTSGESTFTNYEQFVECPRPQVGASDRMIVRGAMRLKLAPRPLADFGLEYEALWLGLPDPFRVSDSGGSWSQPFDSAVAQFADGQRQLHLLWHPDWWSQAFPAAVAALS